MRYNDHRVFDIGPAAIGNGRNQITVWQFRYVMVDLIMVLLLRTLSLTPGLMIKFISLINFTRIIHFN